MTINIKCDKISVVVRKVHKSHNFQKQKEKEAMYVKEFGEVKVVWGKFPKGFLIRQTEEEAILLEEHFDEENENVDVVHRFPADMHLHNQNDFRACLIKAREYERDYNVPIYIMCENLIN